MKWKIKKAATFCKEHKVYIKARDEEIPLVYLGTVDDMYDERDEYSCNIRGVSYTLRLSSVEVERFDRE